MRKLRAAVYDKKDVLLYFTKEIRKRFLPYQMESVCEIFSDSEELLAKVREKEKFDLYFLDISIPKMGGLELAEKIAEEQPQSTIVLSSTRESDIFKIFYIQPFDFIRKQNMEEDLGRVAREFAVRCAAYEEEIW